MSRYFRFGLRTILIVTAIAAALFAWLGRDIIRARREKPIIDRIVSAGGTVRFLGNAAPPLFTSNFRRYVEPTFMQSQFGRHYGVYVEKISLRGGPQKRVTDKTLEGICRFELLRQVSLDGKEFTDNCVEELLQVRQLDTLNLGATSITTTGMKRLAECSKLESLNFYPGASDHLDYAPLEPLSEFPALRRLTLFGHCFNDESFSQVGKCTGLVELKVQYIGITDNAFEHLENLQQLQLLEIRRASVSDKSMLSIGKLRSLRSLRLMDFAITDQGLALLGDLQHLESLSLYGCPIDGSGFATFASLPTLVDLDLRLTKLNASGLRHLERATNLKRLSINLSNALTNGDAKALKAKLPNCKIECYQFDFTFRTRLSHTL